jgi:hypothetical protein
MGRAAREVLSSYQLRKFDARTITTSVGALLPVAIRNPLSHSFSIDLTPIRVHTDAHAQLTVRRLQTRAFTYANHIFLGSGESATDLRLMAHEVAHVVQQSRGAVLQHFTTTHGDASEHEAERASAAVMRGEKFNVQQRANPRPQGLFGLSLPNPLTWLANRVDRIPGFRMLTIILGRNPVNGATVPRTAANILRAIVEFIPGGGLITQALDNYGIFDRVGNFVEEQINSLGMTAGAIGNAVREFISSLSPGDILHLGGLWDRAVRIFSAPIDRIISLGRRMVTGIVTIIKDAILMPLARLASQTRGWNLLIAVLGRNPITGEAVPRNAETLIGGFMRLIGQEEVWTNLQRARAVERAWAWFQGALSGLLSFVSQIPTLFVQALRSLELMDIVILPRAFIRVGSVFANFAGQFITWAGEQVFSLLQIIFEVLAPTAMPYIRRAGSALRTIFRDPIGFIGNLVRAGIQGFRQFGSHFLTHLRASLIGWLTGAMSGANIYIPQAFNFREIVKFVLSVLGLTWQNIRTKLVRAIGDPAVRVLETGFQLVMTLVTQGPAAAWEQIQQGISNLREMVMEQVMTFVRDRIVQAAITQLVTSLNPAGAFIQAVIAIYNTVMFFVERLRQITQVAISFIDSMAAIASGNITAAANRVEQTMAGLLTLVISFLARLVRLGRVSDAVINIVNRIRAPIDRALDRVVEWIVAQARRLLAAGRDAAGNIVQWWRQRRQFRAEDDQMHALYFSGEGQNAVLFVATTPKTLESQLAYLESLPAGTVHAGKLQQAKNLRDQIRQLVRSNSGSGLPTVTRSNLAGASSSPIAQKMTDLAVLLRDLIGVSPSPPPGDRVDISTEHNITADKIHIRANALDQGSVPTLGLPLKGSAYIAAHTPPLDNRNASPAYYYMRFHLINHKLGGTGANKNNLVWAPSPVNDAASQRSFETACKTLVFGNLPDRKNLSAKLKNVIWARARVITYHNPGPGDTFPGNEFPRTVSLTAGLYVPLATTPPRWNKETRERVSETVHMPAPRRPLIPILSYSGRTHFQRAQGAASAADKPKFNSIRSALSVIRQERAFNNTPYTSANQVITRLIRYDEAMIDENASLSPAVKAARKAARQNYWNTPTTLKADLIALSSGTSPKIRLE